MKMKDQAGPQAGVILSKKKKKVPPKAESPPAAKVEVIQQKLPGLSDKKNPNYAKMIGTGEAFTHQSDNNSRSHGDLSQHHSSRRSGQAPSARKEYDSSLGMRVADPDQNTNADAGEF